MIEKIDDVGVSIEVTDKDENVILKSERLFGNFKEGVVIVSILEEKNGELYAVVEE